LKGKGRKEKGSVNTISNEVLKRDDINKSPGCKPQKSWNEKVTKKSKGHNKDIPKVGEIHQYCLNFLYPICFFFFISK
jgi:hypothetical protein